VYVDTDVVYTTGMMIEMLCICVYHRCEDVDVSVGDVHVYHRYDDRDAMYMCISQV